MLPALLAVAVALVVFGGCGGPSPVEKYAEAMCALEGDAEVFDFGQYIAKATTITPPNELYDYHGALIDLWLIVYIDQGPVLSTVPNQLIVSDEAYLRAFRLQQMLDRMDADTLAELRREGCPSLQTG